MTPRRLLLATALLSASGALHAAGLVGFGPRQATDPRPAGGQEAPALLGNSFADLAAGSAVPVAPDPDALLSGPGNPIAAVSSAPMPSVNPLKELGQAATDAATLAPVQASENALRPVDPPKPEPQQARPDRPTTKTAKAAPPKAKGNAPADARKGVAEGALSGRSAKAQAKSSGTGEGGTAQAASYGTDVMRKIRRTKAAKSPGRGSAVVGFVIASSGGLESVRVVKSSGLAALDKVAVEHIRRAAPFPAPPKGAERRFAFEFVGK